MHDREPAADRRAGWNAETVTPKAQQPDARVGCFQP